MITKKYFLGAVVFFAMPWLLVGLITPIVLCGMGEILRSSLSAWELGAFTGLDVIRFFLFFTLPISLGLGATFAAIHCYQLEKFERER